MKKMDISLGDVSNLSIDAIGDHLLKFRRKKKSSKRPHHQVCNLEQKDTPSKPNPLPMLSTPTKLTTPVTSKLTQSEKNPSIELHSKPLLPTPFPSEVLWNPNPSPLQNRSPYHDSPFVRQSFFAPSPHDTPLRSPPGVTAFTPYRLGVNRPNGNGNGFVVMKGILLFDL